MKILQLMVAVVVLCLAGTGSAGPVKHTSLKHKIIKQKTVTRSKKAVKPKKLDINTVDAVTLSKAIKGFGKRRAEAIIAFRTAHGPFKKVDELVNVKGVSANFMAKNKDYLRQHLKFG